MDQEFYFQPQLSIAVMAMKENMTCVRRTKSRAWLIGFLILFACSGAGAQEVDRIVAEVNRYQERARAFVRSLSVVQLVVQESKGDERREKAVVIYRPPSLVDRKVEWTNIGHPSNAFPLKNLIGFPLGNYDYTVRLIGTDVVRGHITYKLKIDPARDKVRRIKGHLWISAWNYGPVKVVGEMTNPPFPIRTLKMEWDYEPGSSGIWMLKRDSTAARAKILFKTIKGNSVAYYDDYELEAEGITEGVNRRP